MNLPTISMQASLQIGFSIEAMGKRVVLRQKRGMEARGVGQSGIPLQFAQTDRGALAVYGVIKHLLGGVSGASGGGAEGAGHNPQAYQDREEEGRDQAGSPMMP